MNLKSATHGHSVQRNKQAAGTVGWCWSAIERNEKSKRALQEPHMDLTTILIIVLLVMLLGGGWYGRGRWYGR